VPPWHIAGQLYFLHGYETVGAEHRLRVFANKVLITIFGPNRGSNARIEKHCTIRSFVYYSGIKARRMGWLCSIYGRGKM
jgi:hypothetical protein